MDTIADEVAKANAACLVHLRGIAKEMVRTRWRMESDAEVRSYEEITPYAIVGRLGFEIGGLDPHLKYRFSGECERLSYASLISQSNEVN